MKNASSEHDVFASTEDTDDSKPIHDVLPESVAAFTQETGPPSRWQGIYGAFCVVLLLISYFLSQYDKFVISYFQAELISDLGISSAGYGALTGYGTSVLSSLTALPIAIFTDHSSARVWALTICILWWSLMIIFQSLSKQFWQMVCARLGMFFGQSASEAIAVSLISDLVPLQYVPVAESVLYVGVYIGEAISARISAVFKTQRKTWRLAFKAVGITGLVVGVVTRVLIFEPRNRRRIVLAKDRSEEAESPRWWTWKWASSEVWRSVKHVASLKSFWLITVSASMRQLAGNVFGYYMPTLLQLRFPNQVSYLVTTYGTIVGTVGSVSCLSGGIATTLLSPRYPTIALHLTAVGGLLSIPFVLALVFSPNLTTLFVSLAFAYITAETWLGAMAGTVIYLLPIRYKTLGYAIYGLFNLLVYSSGPEIVSLAQNGAGVSPTDPDSYIRTTKIILAVLIPFGYATAALGLELCALKGWYRKDWQEIREEIDIGETTVMVEPSRMRRFGLGLVVLAGLVVGLTVASYVKGA